MNDPAAIASFTKNTHLTLYASRVLLCAGWGGTNGKFHFEKEASDLTLSFENQWEVTLKIYYTDELLANSRKSQDRCALREARCALRVLTPVSVVILLTQKGNEDI